MPHYYLAVVGNGGVGKTALINQLMYNEMPHECDPTIEDCYTSAKASTIDGETGCILHIIDTGASELHGPCQLYPSISTQADGILFVYDITHKGSLDEISSVREQICRDREEQAFPMVLVGNKCDLADSARAVSSDEGRNLAADIGCPWMETSARARIRCDEAFFELVREIRKDMAPSSATRPKKSRAKCAIL